MEVPSKLSDRLKLHLPSFFCNIFSGSYHIALLGFMKDQVKQARDYVAMTYRAY
jgi:hypothetical protein